MLDLPSVLQHDQGGQGARARRHRQRAAAAAARRADARRGRRHGLRVDRLVRRRRAGRDAAGRSSRGCRAEMRARARRSRSRSPARAPPASSSARRRRPSSAASSPARRPKWADVIKRSGPSSIDGVDAEHGVTTTRRFDADVAIVGAGPVGLTLAIDLAARGRSVDDARDARARRAAEREVQPRRGAHDGAVPPPRRRRRRPRRRPAGGLPERRRLSHRRSPAASSSRIHIPARATRYTDTSGPDGWWPTPEPPHRINQIYLEPILFAHAEAQARRDDPQPPRGDRLRAGRATACTVDARDLDSGAERRVRARYLVGCDGGRSRVRKAIGARFAGTPVIQRVQSTYIRAPDAARPRSRASAPGAATRSTRAGAASASRSTAARPGWSTTTSMPSEADFEAVDRDWSIRAILGVGADFALRDHQQGGLDRPPPGRRPLPRPARLHLRRRRAPLGAVRRLRHERRHRRRAQPGLAPGRAPRRLGRRSASSTPTSSSGCRSPSRSRTSRWTTRSR